MTKISVRRHTMAFAPLLVLSIASPIHAQTPAAGQKPTAPVTAGQKPAAPVTTTPPARGAGPVAPAGVTPPPDYVIGPEDILNIVFWREKDLSTEAMVRPDGRISVPLINDVEAAGLTPEQLRERLMSQAQRYVEDANVTVVVKAINSRRVFITGQVARPGPYPLAAPTTVLQLIAMAGGVLEYADDKNIVVMRTENGRPTNYRFNYRDVVRQKDLKQNILLKPNDTVVVP
jgi:polysaccharide export outer membrane protein